MSDRTEQDLQLFSLREFMLPVASVYSLFQSLSANNPTYANPTSELLYIFL